jgi:hypothetical protein
MSALLYEAEAQAFAAAHNFDIDMLMFERDRYSFGSLTTTLDAEHEFAVRRRALALAHEFAATSRMSEAA